MPFWRTYYHLVWATSQRAPMIGPGIEGRLHGYLVERAEDMGLHVYAIGGWRDHVHLVVSIPPSLAVAEAVRQLKAASSRHINHAAVLGQRFHWQRGYGAVTLGERQRAKAEEYVRRHKERHQDQQVNRWLERTYEFDEGPREGETPLEGLLAELKESGPAYETIKGHGFPF